MRKLLWPLNTMLALCVTLGMPPFVHGNEPHDLPANPEARKSTMLPHKPEDWPRQFE
jgi:hypothetical protein